MEKVVVHYISSKRYLFALEMLVGFQKMVLEGLMGPFNAMISSSIQGVQVTTTTGDKHETAIISRHINIWTSSMKSQQLMIQFSAFIIDARG